MDLDAAAPIAGPSRLSQAQPPRTPVLSQRSRRALAFTPSFSPLPAPPPPPVNPSTAIDLSHSFHDDPNETLRAYRAEALRLASLFSKGPLIDLTGEYECANLEAVKAHRDRITAAMGPFGDNRRLDFLKATAIPSWYLRDGFPVMSNLSPLPPPTANEVLLNQIPSSQLWSLILDKKGVLPRNDAELLRWVEEDAQEPKRRVAGRTALGGRRRDGSGILVNGNRGFKSAGETGVGGQRKRQKIAGGGVAEATGCNSGSGSSTPTTLASHLPLANQQQQHLRRPSPPTVRARSPSIQPQAQITVVAKAPAEPMDTSGSASRPSWAAVTSPDEEPASESQGSQRSTTSSRGGGGITFSSMKPSRGSGSMESMKIKQGRSQRGPGQGDEGKMDMRSSMREQRQASKQPSPAPANVSGPVINDVFGPTSASNRNNGFVSSNQSGSRPAPPASAFNDDTAIARGTSCDRTPSKDTIAEEPHTTVEIRRGGSTTAGVSASTAAKDSRPWNQLAGQRKAQAALLKQQREAEASTSRARGGEEDMDSSDASNTSPGHGESEAGVARKEVSAPDEVGGALHAGSAASARAEQYPAEQHQMDINEANLPELQADKRRTIDAQNDTRSAAGASAAGPSIDALPGSPPRQAMQSDDPGEDSDATVPEEVDGEGDVSMADGSAQGGQEEPVQRLQSNGLLDEPVSGQARLSSLQEVPGKGASRDISMQGEEISRFFPPHLATSTPNTRQPRLDQVGSQRSSPLARTPTSHKFPRFQGVQSSTNRLLPDESLTDVLNIPRDPKPVNEPPLFLDGDAAVNNVNDGQRHPGFKGQDAGVMLGGSASRMSPVDNGMQVDLDDDDEQDVLERGPGGRCRFQMTGQSQSSGGMSEPGLLNNVDDNGVMRETIGMLEHDSE